MTRGRSLTGEVDLHLPEFENPLEHPIPLLRRWQDLAEEHGVREPGAATLATSGPSGPSTRVVLVKHVDDGGLTFTTSARSRKGQELSSDPRCSVNFYWRETMQQVVVNGSAAPCDPAESDAAFAARTDSARAIAIASAQSEILQDEVALRRQVEDLLERGALERPSSWHAWRLVPDEVEFWHGRVDRFHRRLVYRTGSDGTWRAHRLQP